MSLKLVPFNDGWINHSKLDLHAIYLRPRSVMNEFDEWVPVHDRAAPAFSHSSLAASRCGACGFKLGGAGSPASDGAQLVFCEAASCGKAHHLACVGLAPPAPRAWRCTLHRGGLQGGAPKKMRPA